MRHLPSAVLVVLLLAGCASARPARPAATLPPDSAALLRQALERVRPAYRTQDEALRSGVYAAGQAPGRPVRAAQPPGPPVLGRERGGSSGPEPRRAPRGPDAPQPVPAIEHRFAIQIAAFRDRASADAAAADARRHFGDLTVLVEPAGEWFRVALAGWRDESAARQALAPIQTLYPSAWVRHLAVP